MKKSRLFLGLTSIGVLLTSILVAGTQVAMDNEGLVNDQLGLSRPRIGASKRSSYATADGSLTDEGARKLLADAWRFCEEEEEQGAVLLKNAVKDGKAVLPLEKNERKVTLFGKNSAHLFLRSGAGGAAPNEEKYVIRLDEAFEANGFTINPTIWAKNVSGSDPSISDPREPDVSTYDAAAKASFDDYNDAAFVTFVRTGTEDSDPARGILDLTNNERELLRMIKQSGKFKKTIVLLNGATPLGLDFVDQAEYGVDAVLWFGVPGYYSLKGMVRILTGDVNPSGHAPDTFARHSTSAPAYMNFGNYSYSNGGVNGGQSGGNYVVYKEGIYVGYKYYETRYEDCILGQGNAAGNAGVSSGEGTSWDYAKEVGYPFGFGLSYTTFDQRIEKIAYDEGKDEITVSVKVKNTGSVAGRSSIQVYAQQPFTEHDKTNLIEKSAVALMGYDKVLLEPNQEKTVDVSFDRYFLTSYDYRNAKSYILEDGTYFFGIGNGAHEALNNIIAAKNPAKAGSLVDHDGKAYTANGAMATSLEITGAMDSYKKSHYDKKVDVTNQFDNADVNYWANNDEKITYLTRKDWQGTYPTSMTRFTATDAMKAEINNNRYVKPANAPAYNGGAGTLYSVQLKDEEGNNTRIKFSDMVGVPYSGKFTDKDGVEKNADVIWDKFIKQMSLDDLAISMSDNRGILPVGRIGKPSNSIAEGPEGLLAQYLYGDKLWATGFATGPIYTATWDHEMQRKFGAFYGEEALFCGAAAVNAPGTNICRTPYTSRASEYMSEDGLLNYYTAANVVSAAFEKGLIMNIKHCFLNNQEQNRHGVCTFSNEQAIREIYLKPFEGALTRGGGMGIMTSYNRIGCTYAAVHSHLMKDVMRGEWAYKGLIIDDAQTGSNDNAYANGPLMLDAGTEIFCLDSDRGSQLVSYVSSNNDGHLLQMMQKANKDIMYALLRSWMGDIYESGEEIEEKPKWWKPVLYAIDGTLGGLTFISLILFIVFEAKKEKGEKA